MKPLLLSFLLVLLFGVGIQAQSKWETTTFTVYGNCGMCEKRIEDALFVPGIKLADWDTDTKELKVTYKASKITLKEIHEKVAEIGHDTDLAKASDEVYDNLHGCCKYERPKI